MMRHRPLAVLVLLALIASACSSAADQVAEEVVDPTSTTTTTTTTITTATTTSEPPEPEFAGTTILVGVPPDTPGMQDIIALTPEFFTGPTGIEVGFLVASELELLEDVSLKLPPRFDVLAFDNFFVLDSGRRTFTRLLDGKRSQQSAVVDLTPFAEADADYDIDDLIPSVRSSVTLDGQLFGAPFYAESSIVMFNQDVMDAAGITVPEQPTWEQIADIAAQVQTEDVAGICLQGVPGWDDLGATLTTVVNTFGGTWWEANEDGTPSVAQINQPDSGFRTAAEFYIDLAQNFGIDDPANAGFDQCLDEFQNGNVALWYDSTSAAPILEASNSPIAGNVGYTLAPTNLTNASGWLRSQSFVINDIAETRETVEASWEFISWATSAEFARIAAENLPGDLADVEQNTRLSTHANPEFVESNQPYGDLVLEAITTSPIDNPGTTPRPGVGGVQFVGVPEFQDIANRCTQHLSDAIAGETSVDDALDACQEIASEISLEG